MNEKLTHFDENGSAVMVDVTAKTETDRTAIAEGWIRVSPQTMQAIIEGTAAKGDVLGVARIAGIMGVKRTPDLIPLCHPVPVDQIEVSFSRESDTVLRIVADTKCSYKTGIEMEALTAVSVAALTVYDMCKAMDRGMVIEEIRLLQKTGGKSDYNYERSV